MLNVQVEAVIGECPSAKDLFSSSEQYNEMMEIHAITYINACHIAVGMCDGTKEVLLT